MQSKAPSWRPSWSPKLQLWQGVQSFSFVQSYIHSQNKREKNMKQRDNMKHLLYFLTVLTLLTGCNGDITAPVEITLDRDNCERCRMVISDKHFAAQVRGGPKKKAYLFDDMGCAVHWLKKQAWGEDETTKIWVTDYRNGRWLDARKAYYVSGQITPMDFGLGAVAEQVEGSMDFETAKAVLLAKKHKHHKP